MTNKTEVHVVMGCVHLPFHNQAFFNAICKYIKDISPTLTGVHLIGDILDMHSISRHSKGKIHIEGLTLSKEYEGANKALDRLDSAIGKRKVIKNYFWGNHEDWYNQELSSVDSFKLGRGVIKSPTEACKFKERGYKVQESWKDAYVQLGDLLIVHGEYINKHSASKHLEVFKQNILFAHTHTIQQYDEANLSAYNIGCLIDIDSDVFKYCSRAARTRWRNGFAVVFVDSNKKSHVNIVRWNGSCFVIDGRVYN